MTRKREILALLTADELRALVERFELSVDAAIGRLGETELPCGAWGERFGRGLGRAEVRRGARSSEGWLEQAFRRFRRR